MTTVETALTPGDIARRLEEPWHRVNHILSTRAIRPVARIGNVRVFAPDALDQVRAELAAIDLKRRAAGRESPSP